ncbi:MULTISPECIES: hypothetical protein [unclassified Tardiphaga]|uniref:hypothetical protein n=1 Tax=unclassified Tardiphaga TaxID=2631404 RepID=UPI0019B7FD2B|nr:MULTISPECIES: hypothetical protein [unclassified Tardiphaga]MBC7582927.1 hypothetical protein [Tardiphaga sp.]
MAEDFGVDFFTAFFAAGFFAAFLVVALRTFVTKEVAASFVASAALLKASVICSKIGVSSFILSPKGYRFSDDSPIRFSDEV